VDLGDRFLRLQCKTGTLRRGVIHFNTVSIRSSMTRTVTRAYDGEVDAFAVHCPRNGRTYLVPVTEVAKGICSLRVTPTANGQRRGVRWAADYELPEPAALREPETGLEPVRAVLQERCSTN
jgi:hypothetical protein